MRMQNLRRLWPDPVTWVVGLGSTAALAGQSGSPWMVNALTASIHYSPKHAGLMVTAEMIAMGLVMILVAPIIYRLPAKRVAMAALSVIVIGELVSAGIEGLGPMTLVRVSTGAAFGLLFALVSAFGARSSEPARTFATAGVIALLVGTTINPLLGFGLVNYGHAGVFVGIAAFAGIVGGALIFVRFPAGKAVVERSVNDTAPFSLLAASGVMTVMALLAIATNGVFVFLTTVAAGVGLQGTQLGTGMAVVSLVSALGGVVAARLGNSVGVLPPLVVGLAGMGASLFGLTVVATPVQFWIAFTSLVSIFWFLWPYIFGLAVVVDGKGRVAAATGSAKILAGGLGSGISGYVVEGFGLPTFGAVAAGLCFIAIIIALLTERVMRAPRDNDQSNSLRASVEA